MHNALIAPMAKARMGRELEKCEMCQLNQKEDTFLKFLKLLAHLWCGDC